MKNLVLMMIVVLMCCGLAACANTFHGAGEDIENAGEGVQKAVPPKR